MSTENGINLKRLLKEITDRELADLKTENQILQAENQALRIALVKAEAARKPVAQ